MICSSCRQSLLTRISNLSTKSFSNGTRAQRIPARRQHYHTTPASYSSAPTAPTSRSSPSITQPLSSRQSSSFPGPNTSETPSSSTITPNELPPSRKPNLPISAVAGGNQLKGLGYLKNRSQVMAMEDDEYPDWLWTLLEEKDAGSNVDEYGMEKVDLNAMSKKERQRALKRRQALLGSLPKKIPPHERSTNLTEPTADGTRPTHQDHLKAREEVVKSSRQARRKSIKEKNYLGGV